MYSKILTVKGIQQLTKKEQSNIIGSHSNQCNSNGSGSTGESCTNASQCTPLLSGFPVFCFRGCCLSAY